MLPIHAWLWGYPLVQGNLPGATPQRKVTLLLAEGISCL